MLSHPSAPDVPQPTPRTLQHAMDDANMRVGSALLTDEDLLVLCAAEISRTFTRDEKGYAAV